MFDVGRLVAKLELIGSDVFGRQVDQAGQKTEQLGDKAASSGKKAAALGDGLDATGKKATDTAGKLGATQKATEGVGKGFDDTVPRATTLRDEFRGLGEDGFQATTHVGQGLLGLAAPIIAMSTLAVVKFAEFDAQMSRTQAVIQGTVEQQNALRDAAVDAGGATIYTATEAARAEEELAKAGVQVSDILSGGLTGSLSLAAAGQLEVADAAEIAATALVQFKLKGSDVPHVADLLAAGAGKAQGSVEDMSYALKQSGLVASQMGLSVEETVGTLAAFAKGGLIGSDAGTSFRQMLLSLANPTGKAADLLEQYNIKQYDSEGHFVSMDNLAGQLKTQLGGLGEEQRNAALATIFGTDAIRAANVLYEEGSAGIRHMTDEVNDNGYAARFAAEAQNNLAGDVEKLGGAFDTALIQGGSGANDALRDLIQSVTGLIDWFNQLDPSMQQTLTVLGLLVGGALLLGGTLLITVPKVVQFMDAVGQMGDRMGTAKAKGGQLLSFLGGPWGVALAAAGAALAILNQQIQDGVPTQAELTNALHESASGADLLKAASSRGGVEEAFWGDYYDSLKDLPELLDQIGNDGWDFLNLTPNQLGAADSIKRVGDTLAELAGNDLPAAQEQFARLTDEYNLNQERQVKLLDSMPAYRDALVEQATSMGLNVSTSDAYANSVTLLGLASGSAQTAAEGQTESLTEAADAYLHADQGASDLLGTLTELIAKILEANGVGQDAVSSNAAYRESLDGVAQEVERQKQAYIEAGGVADDFRFSIDENTTAGASNAAMLSDVAAKSQEAAKAQFILDQQTMSGKDATDKYIGTLNTGRQALYDQIVAITGNADAAQALTDKVYAIPDQHSTQIIAETAAASSKIDEFRRKLDDVPGFKDVVINQMVQTTGADRGLVGAAYNAEGGIYAPHAVKMFAGGGFHENQISQLATAGTTRIWNEESPYEEAFISSNPAYRDRSVSILKNRAESFGYQLVEKAGAATMPSSSGGGAMRLSGTLDLGNGLKGYVEGVVEEVLDDVSDTARRGNR